MIARLVRGALELLAAVLVAGLFLIWLFSDVNAVDAWIIAHRPF
jgi:hypothetical protein